MSSILADMESHFEPMSGKYCIKHNWSVLWDEIYEKIIPIRMTFRYKSPAILTHMLREFTIKFRCRYCNSYDDEFKYFTIRLCNESYHLFRTSLRDNFKNSTTDISIDIHKPTIAEVEAAMLPEYLEKLIREQMVEHL